MMEVRKLPPVGNEKFTEACERCRGRREFEISFDFGRLRTTTGLCKPCLRQLKLQIMEVLK